jgi:predicted nucleic acid-binding Zn ribbon protein
MGPFPPRFIPPLGPGKIGARERVCAQWHGVNLAPLAKARELRAKPVSAFLPKVLADLRMDRRQSEAEVAKVWNHLLDPNIVAHAQPTGLRKGTLFVTVDSNVWLSEIVRWRRKEMLERLQHSFGREIITRISFRVEG